MGVSDRQNRDSEALRRLKENLRRQGEMVFGPKYRPAKKAVRGEVGEDGVSGTLPAPKLGRTVHAQSVPERVIACLLLYHPDLFELHEQHLYYPDPRPHPLASHPRYRTLPWPLSDGTLSLARGQVIPGPGGKELACQKYHPAAWDAEAQEWAAGAWVGDFLGFFHDQKGPYTLFYEVKKNQADHGKPGRPRRLSEAAWRTEAVRRFVCGAYAAQLGSRVVEVSQEEVPPRLAATLYKLCTAQNKEPQLPDMLVSELLQCFRESVGADCPPRILAGRLTTNPRYLQAAKELLEIAVWQRKVRVDLYQPVDWDGPLLPERRDVLEAFAHFFARPSWA